MVKKNGILLLGALLTSFQLFGQEPAISEVNTKYNEVKPVVSPDGSRLYFARSNHPVSVGGRTDRADVWEASLADAIQADAQHHSAPLNTDRFDAAAGFSADGSYMYLLAYDSKKVANRQSGLYRVKTGAINPVPEKQQIRYFLNKGPHFDASIASDGKTMILSMESYSTYGLEDLYVSQLQQDGTWSEPRNLGNAINTPKQEMSGFLAADGRTLYFTTNRPGGMGSMDIWVSTRLDDSWKNWSTPTNLGPSVNTSGADMYYWEPVSGDWAYFSSTQNSQGFGDIRRVQKPEPPTPEMPVLTQEEPVVRADTSMAQGLAPLKPKAEEKLLQQGYDLPKAPEVNAAEFQLKGRLNTPNEAAFFAKVLIKNGLYADSVNTASSFLMSVPSEGNYTLRITAPGFFAKDTAINIQAGIKEIDLELRPLEVGATVRLENVMFRRSTAVLQEGSQTSLDEVVRLMQENPSMEILLTGHTDNQGSSRANIKLSRERVEAVKNYLVSRGISASRIEGKGFGGSRPVASNASEETRKLNRRVEFTIVKK